MTENGDSTEIALLMKLLIEPIVKPLMALFFCHQKGSVIYVHEKLSVSGRVLLSLWEMPRLPLHL